MKAIHTRANYQWRRYFDRAIPLVLRRESVILVSAPFVRPLELCGEEWG